MKIRWLILLPLFGVLAFAPSSCETHRIRIGSKKFTESVILGEMAAHLCRDADAPAVHYQELGGTRLVFEALATGQIDIYPEYTGTLTQEIFAGRDLPDLAALRVALRERGLLMTETLGFNNGYALGMRKQVADAREIRTISDLKRWPDLRFGFGNEFLQRGDGWPSLRDHYGLTHTNVRGMDHDVGYRQLESGQIDVIDLYTTDAEISYYDLRVLADDLNHFVRYDAVILYREDVKQHASGVVPSLKKLEGVIAEDEMIAMNSRAKLRLEPETHVAADFLSETLGIGREAERETVLTRITKHTKEHLDLVRMSLGAAILVAIPMGIVAAKRPRFGQVILAAVGIIQTIPALALLVILIKPVSSLGLSGVGPGSAPAIVALFLYSLLPIVRNTYTGLRDIPLSIRESAAALGLPALARLRLVELPTASRTILAGIKTAAVINVGFATLGALIGAGGYGQPILTGIRLNDYGLILQGALPAAGLAVLVQGIFELAERIFVPQGLRLKRTV